jgi:hypothetical protein
MWMLVGTWWNWLARFEKGKRWGGVPKLYKRARMCQIFKELGTALTCLLWKIVRPHCQSLTWNNHFSKPNFYLSVLQMKSSSTCLITASLYEGPFFYFYVESPPSTFMHRLREHSCHYEYLVALLNLKVSYAFMVSSPWRISWKPSVCFSIWFEHTFDFHCFIFMIFCLCSFSCYNMVAKLLLSRLYLSWPCFKFFWSHHSMLTYMIKIV